ncbi:MAG: DUF362 domain-containing protein [Bacteroidales bacterium]|jgi:uncharacterized protein (DUF362 family)/Pyruvate/2-oxoacid:ferredoxin oxidoreductase delta subunit|nr:DUF362 domain-containing protein [Bacteroidales bacterium]
MNPVVSCRSCSYYDVDQLTPLLESIYAEAQGPDIEGKRILLKPNVLFDEEPQRAITTHPAFLEAVIKFLQSRNAAKIYVGDAPAIHGADFKPRKSGIWGVCEKTGAEWTFFGKNASSFKLKNRSVPIASIIHQVDYIFSLPKLKTHELMGYTGAIKNSFGLIPGLNKAAQHAFHQSAKAMGKFLLDLNEARTPDFIFMDAILAMEGEGPGNGIPYSLNLALGSTNPLAIDMIAAEIIGYNPLQIETNRQGMARKKWLDAPEDIILKGADIKDLIRDDFQLIQRISMWKMMVGIVLRRIPALRRFERRPIFNDKKCAGCKACIEICPVSVLSISDKNSHKVMIKDRRCIRCFCCHEVCKYDAIEIKKSFFR